MGTTNQRVVFDSDEGTEISKNDKWTVEKLVAADYPDIATFEYHRTRDHTYTTEAITMKDGQTYNKLTNPLLSDLFAVDDSAGKPVLTAIIKENLTVAEQKVKARKTYVNRYNEVYGFSSDIQTQVDNFITAADSYSNMMAQVYPWQLDSLNDISGCFATPKIPSEVVLAVAGLPVPPNTPNLQ